MPDQKKFRDEILDSVGEGLLTVDKNFKVNFFNRAAEQITGYNRYEVLGQFCKYVFKCEMCETKCPIGVIPETSSSLFDFRSSIEIKDGSRKSIKHNAAIMKNGNKEPAMIAIIAQQILFLQLKSIIQQDSCDSQPGIQTITR